MFPVWHSIGEQALSRGDKVREKSKKRGGTTYTVEEKTIKPLFFKRQVYAFILLKKRK
jgi:hypothetical protein